MRFIDQVENIVGLYGKDVYNYSTRLIYEYRKEGSVYLQNSDKGLIPGGIFQIKYDFGGIKTYKFILSLEISKMRNNKIVVAAINIHDLTREFRIFFFNKFFSEQIEANEFSNSANVEPPFNLGNNKNDIYQYLKQNDNNYAIQLYSITDISEIKRISTNILDKVIFFKTSEANSNYLKMILRKLSESSVPKIKDKQKIKELVDKYDQLLENFNDSSKEYHKKLQYFERNIKLYDKL